MDKEQMITIVFESRRGYESVKPHRTIDSALAELKKLNRQGYVGSIAPMAHYATGEIFLYIQPRKEPEK